MKIFVINLDRRPDRLNQISDKLRDLGLEFERIPATDGTAIDLKKHTDTTLAWFWAGFQAPLPGAVGCFLSHQRIWRKMFEESVDQALVIEDDANLVDWDARILDVSLADNRLDLLRIGVSKPVQLAALRENSRVQHHIVDRRVLHGQTNGTCAYLISQSGLKKCLMCDKFWFAVDKFDLWESYYGLQTAVLDPPLAVPSGDPSDIKPPSTNFPTPHGMPLRGGIWNNTFMGNRLIRKFQRKATWVNQGIVRNTVAGKVIRACFRLGRPENQCAGRSNMERTMAVSSDIGER